MSTIEQTMIPAGTWTADPAHSSVEFAVKHMKIVTVRGFFGEFQATVTGGDEPRVEGTINVASVNTRDAQRDGHLQSPEFFDAERHPEATIASSEVVPGRITADLTLRGVTRPVEFEAKVVEGGSDPWGHERIGLELTGTIDRREFGIDWNAPLPDGGFLLDDVVTLHADLSLIKQV
jgi:polyisoprenoid-binding protein YceI